jgi:uncharacterized DUF497 family protein
MRLADDQSRGLFVVFTARAKLICVISARDATRKEGRIYQTHEKTEEKGLFRNFLP